MKNKDNDKYGLLVLNALEFFIENPYDEVYLREFSRKLKISPNTSQRFLNLFLKEGLITEIKRGNLRYFKPNLENLLFKHIKKTYSIKKIIDSGIISSLNNFAAYLVLFGSMAKGLDDKNSDMDLLIISQNKKKIMEIISILQKKISAEINPHIFSWAEWKKQAQVNKAFYQDIISTGINLIGEIPIIN